MAETCLNCPCKQLKEAMKIVVGYHRLLEKHNKRQKKFETVFREWLKLQIGAPTQAEARKLLEQLKESQ